MATTEHFKDGGGTTFDFSFPILANSDLKVEVYNASSGLWEEKTEDSSGTTNATYTISNTKVIFNGNTPPSSESPDGTGGNVHIYRTTNVDNPQAVYAAGSSIRAVDLNNNQTQVLYSTQETATQLVREADLENQSVTSAKIKDGTIVNADINASAEIAESKLANGSARQLLQTDAAGTGVEWSSNIDIPGTLDVTGNVDLDSNLNVDGTTTLDGTTVDGALNVNGSTTLDGTTIDGDLDVNGSATVGNLSLGTSTVHTTASDLTLNSNGGTVRVNDNLYVQHATDIDGDLNVDGTTTLNGTTIDGILDVNGSTSIDNVQINVSGDNEIDTASGNLTIDSAGGTVNVDDALTVTGNLSANDSLSVNTDLVFRKIGDHFFIDNAHDANSPQSNLYIRNNFGSGIDHSGDIHIQAKAGEEGIVVSDDGAVSLYTNGALQFTTALTTAFGNLSNAHMSPYSSDSFNLGHDALRWKDIYVNDIKGDSIVTSGTSDSDSKVYSAKRSDDLFQTEAEVDARIITLVDNVGGFVPIANETSFPTENPDINTENANKGGTIISIKALDNDLTTGAGENSKTITDGRGSGNGDVLIIGLTADTTYGAGMGMLLETTATDHTYLFHRTLANATDVKDVAGIADSIPTVATNVDSINNFTNLYQIDDFSPLAPTTDGGNNALSAGDLAYDSTANVLKVYTDSTNGWQAAASLNGSGGVISGDITFNDNVELKLGGGGDLRLYHDTNNSVIDNEEGDLYINSAGGIFIAPNNNEAGVYVRSNGAVELYNDGAIKLATTSTGVDVTGNLNASSNVKADAQIIGSSSNAGKYVRMYGSAGTGRWDIYGHGANLRFSDNDSAGSIVFDRNLDANGGIDVGGDLTATGDLTISSATPIIYLTDTGENPDWSIKNGNGDFNIKDESAGKNRLAINSSGNVGIGTSGPVATASNYDSAAIHIHQTDSASAGSQIHLTNGATGAAAGNGAHISMWSDDDLYITNQESDGKIKFGSGGNADVLTINDDGNVGIGTSSPSTILDIESTSPVITLTDSDATNDPRAEIDGSDGSLVLSADANQKGDGSKIFFKIDNNTDVTIDHDGNIGAPSGSNVYNASDSRLKKNVVDIDKGLSSIKSLRPVSFNWIDGFCEAEKETLYGFIAQEVQSIDSNLVQDFSKKVITIDGTKIENVLRVNEKFIIPILVKAVQELTAKVEALEAA